MKSVIEYSIFLTISMSKCLSRLSGKSSLCPSSVLKVTQSLIYSAFMNFKLMWVYI